MAEVWAKIWADIFADPWFVSLSLAERGAWLQLIVYAKMNGDTGKIGVSSGAALGSVWGCDGKTSRKFLGNFHEASKIHLKETPHGSLEITIVNYKKYQGDKQNRSNLMNGTLQGNFPEPSPQIRLEERDKRDKKERKKEVGAVAPGRNSPAVAVQEIIDLYHLYLPFATKVRELTKTRIGHLFQRLKDHPDLKWWENLFKNNIATSPFLRGEIPPRDGYKQFKLNIDWLINPTNLAKIIEGMYAGERTDPVKPKSENERRVTEYLERNKEKL